MVVIVSMMVFIVTAIVAVVVVVVFAEDAGVVMIAFTLSNAPDGFFSVGLDDESTRSVHHRLSV